MYTYTYTHMSTVVRGIRLHGPGVTCDCEPPGMVLGTKMWPWQDQYMLLTEPSSEQLLPIIILSYLSFLVYLRPHSTTTNGLEIIT